MDTLNLNGRIATEDNFFQRIFWPTIHNQYDVDTASRRGFWLAVAVGASSAVSLLVSGGWFFALFILATYWLGANGIRERSRAAAALLLSMYLVNLVFTWIGVVVGVGQFRSPFAGVLGIALLLSCVRATLLSRRLAASGNLDFPDRDRTGFTDRLVDVLPPRIWPRTRIVFFVLASLMLLLSVVGQTVILRQAAAAHVSAVPNNRVPDATLNGNR